MVEPNTLAQCERPREPIGGRAPDLRERRRDGERLVERDQAVENVLCDRAPVYIGKEDGIEGSRIVADRPPVDAIIGERLTGGPTQAEEGDESDTCEPRSRLERGREAT